MFLFCVVFAFLIVVNLILHVMSKAVREQEHDIAIGHPAEISSLLFYISYVLISSAHY